MQSQQLQRRGIKFSGPFSASSLWFACWAKAALRYN